MANKGVNSAKRVVLDDASGSFIGTGDAGYFLQLTNDLMLIAEKNGRIRYANPAAQEFFGSHIETLTLATLLHTSVSHLHDGQISRLSCEDYDGLTHILSWRIHKRDDDFWLIGQDQTALAKAQEEFKTQTKQLAEAQAIGHMGHWHWTVGADDITWSDEIFNIFGLTPETFSPNIDSVNRFLHRRDMGRLMQGFQRAIIEKKDYDMEFRIVRPNGDVRHVACEGRCALDEDGDVISLYGIMQDITERVLYEEELKAAKDASERAYAAKSQFLANMSHELRTPLNAIIGFSEMMHQEVLGPLENDKYKEYVGGIKESGEHLLDLITDILDMSKIEAGKYELDLEEFKLERVIKVVRQMMCGRAEEAGVTLQINVDDEQAESRSLVADRRAVTQILLNLISNAIKFTQENGKIEVSVLERTDYLLLRVADNGIGIPANRLPYITRPFEQIASEYARDHQGSGLGLAITKELVELHCGSMHIDSVVGQGTSVSIRLPYDTYAERKRRERNAQAALDLDEEGDLSSGGMKTSGASSGKLSM